MYKTYSQALPDGFYSSNSEDEDCIDGFYFGSSTVKTKKVEKSPKDLMKERLLQHLKHNDVGALREELNHGPFKGFDIDEHLDHSWNLLFHACSLGHPEIVRFLIEERGVDTNSTEDTMTALMVACSSEAKTEDVLKVVKLLIKDSTLISSPNNTGGTAFMFASKYGHVEVVKYLLSLNDSYDAMDNEGKNALFHAIDGKQVEVARLLIESGIDLNVVNQYGCTAKNYAIDENQNEIIELFPPEAYRFETPCNFLSYNQFSDLIPGKESEVPAYFPDISAMLRGINLDKFISLFAEARVTLEEFLTITDDRLKEIGVEMPFERNIIKLGLHNFHKGKWSKRSLFIPDLTKDMQPTELVLILANILRQLVVIKSHIIYMKQLGKQYNLNEAYEYIPLQLLHEFNGNTKVLEKQVKKIISKEVTMTNPLLIQKKTKPFNHFVKFSIYVAVPSLIVAAFKFLK